MIVLGIYLFVGLAHAATGTVNEINKELHQYSWYKEVLRFEDIEFNARAAVVNYLEHEGLFRARSTKYCTDDGHDARTNSCYVGQANQNKDLLRSLRTKKVREALSKASPWLIENGKDGKLNRGKRLLKVYEDMCRNGHNPSCNDIPSVDKWAREIDSLRK